jgi:hypothetical protein
MACPQTKNKIVGVFLVHGIMIHIILRQRGFGLVKPKLALSICVFYSRILTWLPRVTKRKAIGMRLNLHMFLRGPK